MKLLFVVDGSFSLASQGLVLSPGPSKELAAGTPLFLIRPDGTHVMTVVRPTQSLGKKTSPFPVLVDLLKDEAPKGTRVFGRDPNSTH